MKSGSSSRLIREASKENCRSKKELKANADLKASMMVNHQHKSTVYDLCQSGQVKLPQLKTGDQPKFALNFTQIDQNVYQQEPIVDCQTQETHYNLTERSGH